MVEQTDVVRPKIRVWKEPPPPHVSINCFNFKPGEQVCFVTIFFWTIGQWGENSQVKVKGKSTGGQKIVEHYFELWSNAVKNVFPTVESVET